MKQKTIYPKVSFDLFVMQGYIAAWFLGVMILVQIIRVIISNISHNGTGTFLVTTYIAASIFMLVLGIIVTSAFLPHYVGNGVTRKDFFKGASLGAIGLSIAIPIVSFILSLIEKGIVTLLKLPVNYETVFKPDVDEDTFILGKVLSTILTPNIDFSSIWVLVLVLFAINLLTFYLIGWLIGSAFYKNIILGFGAILMGIFILYFIGHIMAMLLGNSAPIFTTHIELPVIVLIFILLALIAVSFYMIRLLTKKIVVKM